MVNSALVIGAGNFRGWGATPGDFDFIVGRFDCEHFEMDGIKI